MAIDWKSDTINGPRITFNVINLRRTKRVSAPISHKTMCPNCLHNCIAIKIFVISIMKNRPNITQRWLVLFNFQCILDKTNTHSIHLDNYAFRAWTDEYFISFKNEFKANSY